MHLTLDANSTAPILKVNALSIQSAERLLVDQLSFELYAGQTLALVGESGSGKSISALALMGLLPKVLQVQGSVLLDGKELLELNDAQFRSIRGQKIAIVFQEPMTALNSLHRVEKIIAEALWLQGCSKSCSVACNSTTLACRKTKTCWQSARTTCKSWLINK
jgi:microcin C transport system ATP-binding protein